ncbi:MAG: DUF418 domain-containing protein, partial [Bacteroidales bacterium]|nr:DUF418 domain-containing protein [Bacteroidales bacterium]
GQRYFKVLALFLLGYYIGRQKIFANLDSNTGLLSKVAKIGFAIGVPLSAVYTWIAMQGQPWGAIFHSAIYTLSVYPLGAAYMAAFCLLTSDTRTAQFGRLSPTLDVWRCRAT